MTSVIPSMPGLIWGIWPAGRCPAIPSLYYTCHPAIGTGYIFMMSPKSKRIFSDRGGPYWNPCNRICWTVLLEPQNKSARWLLKCQSRYYFQFVELPYKSKESACNAGDMDSIPKSGRSPGERNVNPLQYSCLESSGQMILAGYIVHGVSKSQIQLSD